MNSVIQEILIMAAVFSVVITLDSSLPSTIHCPVSFENLHRVKMGETVNASETIAK